MIISSPKMSKADKAKAEKEEQKWQARSDANTLRDACEIQNDPARMKRAKAALKEKADEMQKAAKEYGAAGSSYGDKAKSTRGSRTKNSTEKRLEGQRI